MKQFSDTKKRIWTVSIALGEIEAIQDATGVDFGQPENFGKLAGDSRRFKQILWCLIGKQAVKQNLDGEEVLSGFDAGVVDAAIEAVSEELLLFFRNPEPLMKLKAAVEARARVMQGQAGVKLEDMLARIHNGELDGKLGLSSGAINSEASSASTLAP